MSITKSNLPINKISSNIRNLFSSEKDINNDNLKSISYELDLDKITPLNKKR